MIVAGAALVAAAVGLTCVRTAPPLARCAAWCAVVAFALAAAAPTDVAFVPVAPRTARVVVPAAPGELLRAAAAAGPRAVDLELAWRAPLPAEPGTGPLGAVASLPQPALPVDPRRVQVRALGTAAVGRPLLLQVEVPGLGDGAAGELRLRRGDAEVARLPFALAADGTAACEWLPDTAGVHTVALAIDVAGHRLLGDGAVAVAAPPRVVVLDPSGVTAAALAAQGLAVEAADALPDDFRDAAALVLGRSLPPAQQLAVVAAAIDGLGVFALAPAFGGDDAPLRALLPLRPAPREAGAGDGRAPGGEAAEPPPTPDVPDVPRPPDGDTRGRGPVGSEPIEVDKHAIAMVLVVDRSWSMGNRLPDGNTKMSYAKTSALRTAAALGAGDHVALVTFGNKDAGRVELPLTDATDVATVRRGVERLAHAVEFTYLLSGLRMAADVLAPSRAAVRHVVVITDGEFVLSEAVALQDLAMRLRRDARTTVSMVSIVDEGTDPAFKREAERLTQAGGGQFLPIEDPTFVPVLVSAEVTRALQRVGREPGAGTDGNAPPEPPRADEPPPPSPTAAPVGNDRLAVRAVAASPLLRPEPDTWPTLGGAVPGTAPLDARVLLVAGEAGWPLLAFGNRGLGRTGAFAADLGGPDGAEFRRDAAFPARLAQWVAAVLPPAPARAPQALLDGARAEPPVPTRRDTEWLTALGGSAPAVAEATAPPAHEREVDDALPRWALALLLVLTALAVVERYAGLWSLRRAGG